MPTQPPPRRAPIGSVARKSWQQPSLNQTRQAARKPREEPQEKGANAFTPLPRPPASLTGGKEVEFAVSSPRLGAAAALQNLEDMPASLRHALMFIRGLPCLPRSGLDIGGPCLPPQREDAPRRILVLDLDETLVHCSRGRSNTSVATAAPDLYVEFDAQSSLGNVYFRPFVNFFLEVAAKSHEIVVFTASQQHYADKVIDALDPERKLITHRLYRQHCTEMRGAFFKELGLLGRPLSQCILVDNSPISLACNANNGILIKSWYGDRWDEELIDLLGVLQEVQVHGGDSDRFLADRYGLQEFFQALRCGPAAAAGVGGA